MLTNQLQSINVIGILIVLIKYPQRKNGFFFPILCNYPRQLHRKKNRKIFQLSKEKIFLFF